MTPGELRDQEGPRPSIDRELAVEGLGGHTSQTPPEPVYGLASERVRQPPAGVVHQDVDEPPGLLGSIEQGGDGAGFGQVGFDGQDPAAFPVDRLYHPRRVGTATRVVRGRQPGVADRFGTQVCGNHRRSAPGQLFGR